jgi:hypothetical protein
MPSTDIKPATEALTSSILNTLGLSSYILSAFGPQLQPKFEKFVAMHPKLVKLVTLPLALWIGYEVLWSKVYTFWPKTIAVSTSSITIDSGDSALHSSFRRFLWEKRIMQSHRQDLAASESHLRYYTTGGDYYADLVDSEDGVVFDTLNKSQFSWHDGRPYVLNLDGKSTQACKSALTIWTFGWSLKPIRKMIVDAYALADVRDGYVMTEVYVPDPNGCGWTRRSC